MAEAPQIRLYVLGSRSNNTWLLDSGASSHSTFECDDFDTYESHTSNIQITDRTIIKAVGKGTVIFRTSYDKDLILENVLHIPNTQDRILSIATLTKKGGLVKFDERAFSLEYNFEPVADSFQAGGLYWLTVQHIYNVGTATASASLETWHKHMGHMSKEALKRYAQSSCKGLLINDSSEETGICHGCELGKSHRHPFPPSNKCASQLLELVHSDLVGPLQGNSIQWNKYFATFIDDYTRIVVVVPLKSKDQLSGALVHYWQWAERQLEHYKLKCFHSDCGGEYVNKQVKDLLLEVGIEHKLCSGNASALQSRKN